MSLVLVHFDKNVTKVKKNLCKKRKQPGFTVAKIFFCLRKYIFALAKLGSCKNRGTSLKFLILVFALTFFNIVLKIFK